MTKQFHEGQEVRVEFSPFEISDYLDNEKVIAEYLLAAADDPNKEILLRAKSDVEKARAEFVVSRDARP